MKRRLLAGILLFCALAGTLTTASAPATALTATALQCDYRSSPLGIPQRAPLLSWQASASDKDSTNRSVSGWQILVASSPEKLAADEGDLWDTGKQAGNTLATHYAGKKLASGQPVWWKVRLWDESGQPGPWSAPETWSYGPHDTQKLNDWPADWIGLNPTEKEFGAYLNAQQRERVYNKKTLWIHADIPSNQTTPQTAFFRQNITIPEGTSVKKALLWVYPDMRAEVFINGKTVADAYRWELAQSREVASFLTPGKNTLAIKVTQDDGYTPALLGEIEIFLSNGERIFTPLSQWTRFSVTEETGWTLPEFNDSTWKKSTRPPRPPAGTVTNAAAHPYAPVLYLRGEFSVKPNLKRATMQATAMGIYEVEINGQRVGSDYFSPGWTDYSRRIPVQTYDVTERLKSGENAMGIALADGWFAGVFGHMGKKYSYNSYPRARASLKMEYADGSVETFGTSGKWKASYEGPERYADLQFGGEYDLRMSWPDWSKSGFDDKKWQNVQRGFGQLQRNAPTPCNKAVFEGAMLDGVKHTQTIKPVEIKQIEDGRYLVDFGQNFVGWTRVKVNGQAGQKITLRHGEICNPNGTLYTSNLRGAAAADIFHLAGKPDEVLEPRFTFHGFRYMEISGVKSAPKLEDIEGLVMHSPLRQTGWFECSNPMLNQLFQNVLWGQRGNYLEVPTDCPQRDERLGWTGDVQFFAQTGVYNFDSAAFLRRWLVSLAEDAQMADGTMAEITPQPPTRRTTPHTAWGGDAAIICAYVLWQQYDDLDTVRRHFAALVKYMDWLERNADENLIQSIGGFGDWVNKGGTAKTEVIDTAYFANNAALMAEMAEAIGQPEKATHYRNLHERIKAQFDKQFLKEDGSILESSQTGYALAFTMDLITEDKRAAATQQFQKSIEDFNNHLATGFIGTPRLIPGLFNAGLDDTAYLVLQQTTYPSWLYPITLGATTVWEHWDSWTPEKGFQNTSMNSFNHYAFGAVVESFYRYILGITTDGPAFRKIIIRPYPGGGLTYAKGGYDSPQGMINSAWQWSENGEFEMDVGIPVNTTAKIYLPAISPEGILQDGKPLAQMKHNGTLESAEGYVIVPVGSGQYRFSIPPSAQSARAKR